MRRTYEKSSETFKCPNCGTKVLVASQYCLKCKKKVKPPEGTKIPDKKNKEDDKKKKEGFITLLQKERDKKLQEKNSVDFTIKEVVRIKQPFGNLILEKGDEIKVFPKED